MCVRERETEREREGRNRRYFSRLAKFTTAGVAPDS